MAKEKSRQKRPAKFRFCRRYLDSLSIRTRFFLGVGLILLCFCSICAYIIYRQGKLLIEDAAHAKSQIVMAAVEASQNYVRQVLRPKLYEILGKDAFVLEGMSTSYVSRAIMDRFNESMPEYHYRRVAVNARNPNSEANPTEARMLNFFAANPDKTDWEGILLVNGQSNFMRFRPVRFGASCLHCHGAVADAPKPMLEKYGAERGFGHQVGDLAGVTAIGIPVDVALGQLQGKAFAVFMSCLFGAGVLYVVISSFFNRLVATDLRKILDIFHQELPAADIRTAADAAPPPVVGLGDVPQDLQWAEDLKLFEVVQAQDEVEEITLAARDMARRLREKQARLVQSKELLQSVFDSITDSLILMDRDLRIRMVNRACLRRYHLQETEVLGQRCNDLHPGDFCSLSAGGMQKVVVGKKPVTEEVQSPAGEIFRIRFYPVLDEHGEVVSIVRSARDITDQRRLEQNIQRTEKLASLGQLAAGVAHEINNPLGVVLTYTDLLKQQLPEPSEIRDDVDTIEKHTLTCKRIVADLLKFARGESAQKQLASLNRTIEEAVELVAHQFSRNQVAIRLNLNPDLPLLSLDVDKIKQVFLNLLMNARQAIDAQGDIEIRTDFRENEGEVQVQVRDNGKGIPPDLLEKIFDPFFSTKATGEGTGLGLSVSYGIIKEHGGDIQVQSEPGRGTQFTLHLPVSTSS